jgi:hypothetical protein
MSMGELHKNIQEILNAHLKLRAQILIETP